MNTSLQDLQQIFGSRMKAQEIFFLVNDQKAVVRQGFYEPELQQVETFCQQNCIFFVRSPFKVLLTGEGKFSDTSVRVTKTDPRTGMFFLYLSKKEQYAWRAAYAELRQDHRRLGKLLGYPDCCNTFFEQAFSEQQANLSFPATNPWTNTTKRAQDFCLLSHFPCSQECAASKIIAQQNLASLERTNPSWAQLVWEQLAPK